MARRLRSVKLDEISFVGKGDNPEAHVLLLKMKQDKTDVNNDTKGDSNMDEKLKKELEDKITAFEKEKADLIQEKADFEKAADAKAKELEMKLEEEKAKGVKKEADEDVYKGLPEAIVKEIQSNRERIAKMEDESITREYVAKAAEVGLVGKADELGDMLKTVAKTDATLADKILDVFKTAQARIKESGLLGEIGKEDHSSTGATAYDKIVAKAVELRKSNPALTDAQAFTKVYDSDSDLRVAYLKERK